MYICYMNYGGKIYKNKLYMKFLSIDGCFHLRKELCKYLERFEKTIVSSIKSFCSKPLENKEQELVDQNGSIFFCCMARKSTVESLTKIPMYRQTLKKKVTKFDEIVKFDFLQRRVRKLILN